MKTIFSRHSGAHIGDQFTKDERKPEPHTETFGAVTVFPVTPVRDPLTGHPHDFSLEPGLSRLRKAMAEVDDPDATRAFEAFEVPVRDTVIDLPVQHLGRFRRAFTPPATGTEAVHLTAVWTGRTPIGDSIPGDGGQLVLTSCRHCGAQYSDPSARTFAQLRDAAQAHGWRLDAYGCWVCPRDVRANPMHVPLMPPAERTRAA